VSELNTSVLPAYYTPAVASMLADFQPYMDANEQEETALTGVVGGISSTGTDLASGVGDAANAAGYQINNGVVQAGGDLHNAGPGENAMLNKQTGIDLSGATFVENLQGFIPPPMQYTHVPQGDVLITWEGREGQHWKFWPADKPLPKGTRLVTQAEIDATLNGTGNELASTTQAG